MINTIQTLMVYEDNIVVLLKLLKTNTIRMASSLTEPWNPLRKGQEISLDSSGQFLLPSNTAGISLAASIKQLDRIWKAGRDNYIFIIDRNFILPEGLAFIKENDDHWIIVVTRKMHKDEFVTKLSTMVANWKMMGRYIRHG